MGSGPGSEGLGRVSKDRAPLFHSSDSSSLDLPAKTSKGKEHEVDANNLESERTEGKIQPIIGEMFTEIVTPIKIRPSKKSMRIEEASHEGTQLHFTETRRFVVPPNMEILLSATLIPIKRGVGARESLEPRGPVLGKETSCEPMLEVWRAPYPDKERSGSPLGATRINLTTTDEENFEDATKELQGNKGGQGPSENYTNEKMPSLLEDINLLVDKERTAMSTLEDEQRKCKEEIKEMGQHIYLLCRETKKAKLSLGVGFRIVKDSQPTSSRSNYKKRRGAKEKSPICKEAILTIREMARGNSALGVTPKSLTHQEIQSLPTTIEAATRSKTRCELYGPVIMPTKPASVKVVSSGTKIATNGELGGRAIGGSPFCFANTVKTSWLWRQKIHFGLDREEKNKTNRESGRSTPILGAKEGKNGQFSQAVRFLANNKLIGNTLLEEHIGDSINKGRKGPLKDRDNN